MTNEEAIEDLTVLRERIDPEQWEAYIRDIDPEALDMAIEAMEGRKASETEVLRKIQQECNQNLTCTGCRFQGIDEYDFRSCKMHVPACWIIDEQEAAAEDAQDTIPVQSGAEHDMQ